MRTTTSAMLALSVLTLLGSAVAQGGVCHQDPYLVMVGDLYVVNDLCQLDPVNPCIFSIWIYQETNGVEGLQRCDDAHMDDNCFCPPDTVII